MLGTSLAFHFFLLAALELSGVGLATAPSEAPPDLLELMREVQRVHSLDMAAWSRFRFEREVHRQRFDSDGQVVSNELYEFKVTPQAGGFDEELTSLDGAAPTARQVKRHRKEARFNRHYNGIRSGQEDRQDDEGSPLMHLLHLPSYAYAGREEVEGVECYRLDFGAQQESKRGGLQARISRAMAGSLWIDVEDHHLVRAHARTVRPVSVALSLAKVHDVQVDLVSRPVAQDVWLPERLEVRTEGRVSWWPIRRRSTFRYSDFKPAHDMTAGVAVGEPVAAP